MGSKKSTKTKNEIGIHPEINLSVRSFEDEEERKQEEEEDEIISSTIPWSHLNIVREEFYNHFTELEVIVIACSKNLPNYSPDGVPLEKLRLMFLECTEIFGSIQTMRIYLTLQPHSLFLIISWYSKDSTFSQDFPNRFFSSKIVTGGYATVIWYQRKQTVEYVVNNYQGSCFVSPIKIFTFPRFCLLHKQFLPFSHGDTF